MNEITPAAVLSDKIVLDAVMANPEATSAELRIAIPIKGITKKDINKILYRLAGEGKVVRTPTEKAPMWSAVGEPLEVQVTE